MEIGGTEEVNTLVNMTLRCCLTQGPLQWFFSPYILTSEKRGTINLFRRWFLLTWYTFHSISFFSIRTQCSWLWSFPSTRTFSHELVWIILICGKNQLASVCSEIIFSLFGERWGRQRRENEKTSWAWGLRLRTRTVLTGNLRIPEFWTDPGRNTVVRREVWKGCYWAAGEKSMQPNSTTNHKVPF